MTSPRESPSVPGDDDQNTPRDRIDADPPYGTGFPERVKRFRDLLAELIARQILAERRGTKDPDSKTTPLFIARQADRRPAGPDQLSAHIRSQKFSCAHIAAERFV